MQCPQEEVRSTQPLPPLCLLSPPRRISSSSAPPILTVTSFWLCSQTSRLHWDVVKGTTRCFVKFYFAFNSYDTSLWDSVWCFGVLSFLFKRIFFFKRKEIQKISSQMKRELSRRKKIWGFPAGALPISMKSGTLISPAKDLLGMEWEGEPTIMSL